MSTYTVVWGRNPPGVRGECLVSGVSVNGWSVFTLALDEQVRPGWDRPQEQPARENKKRMDFNNLFYLSCASRGLCDLNTFTEAMAPSSVTVETAKTKHFIIIKIKFSNTIPRLKN